MLSKTIFWRAYTQKTTSKTTTLNFFRVAIVIATMRRRKDNNNQIPKNTNNQIHFEIFTIGNLKNIALGMNKWRL